MDTPIIGDAARKVASIKANSEAHSIADHFTQYLEPELALTPKSREEVFQIRHNVYCDELNFLPTHQSGLETDSFDAHSELALIKHKPSNIYTGCIRVVKSSDSSEQMPIEYYCGDSMQHDQFHPRYFKRGEICEFSRLAVKNQFRRRKNDRFTGSATGVISETTYSETELRCFPFIAIGLYMTAATIAIESGINHAFVMMEPRLARSMQFVGIKFEQIGPAIEYHGKRAPYYINADMFLNNLSNGFQSLFLEINKTINQQIRSSGN